MLGESQQLELDVTKQILHYALFMSEQKWLKLILVESCLST